MATKQARDNAAVIYEFYRLKLLFDTGLLSDPQSNWDNPFYISVLFETFIHMNDLVMKIRNTPYRISFTDDIKPHPEYTDITGLINYIRNAICHGNNDKRDAGNNIVAFGMNVEVRSISNIGGKIFTGGHPNDGKLQMGEHTIYIRRHLLRAWEELKIVYRAMPAYPTLKQILQ